MVTGLKKVDKFVMKVFRQFDMLHSKRRCTRKDPFSLLFYKKTVCSKQEIPIFKSRRISFILLAHCMSCSFFTYPGNIRKPEVLLYFRGVWKENLYLNWVKQLEYSKRMKF